MKLIRRIILIVIVLILLSGVSLFAFAYYSGGDSIRNILSQIMSPVGQTSSNERPQEIQTLPTPTFLSTDNLNLDATLEINLSTLFTAPVVFEQDITAPNILYSLDAGDGIELTGDPQNPTITNTGLLSLQGLTGALELTSDNITISTSGNTITFSADIPSLPDLPDFPDGEIVGTTDTQLLSNKTVTDLTFQPSTVPTAVSGKVYYDSLGESLYVYTDTYGWRDMTAGSVTYTTDGEGIELVGNEFQLELDGTTLTKSASGLRVNGDVSLLGQSIDTTEIEDGTIEPVDINTDGVAGTNGYVLTYNGANSLFQWLSPSVAFGSNWSRDVNGILFPTTPDDGVLVESSTNVPLTLTSTGSNLAFLVNDEVGDTTPFAIDSSGNVGIGTSTPQYPLDVMGVIGVNNTRAVYVPNQSTFTGSIILGTGGTNFVSGAGRGQNNTFVGIGAGDAVSNGYSNTILGASAGLQTTTGYQNTFVGQNAGYSNQGGFSNTYVGRSAGSSTIGGSQNVFVGDSAGQRTTSGRFNTFLGTEANRYNLAGDNNVIIGYQAGYSMGIVNNNIGNIFIGYQAGYNELSVNNKLFIENSNSSSPLIWGDFTADIVGINGALGVGTQSPEAKLNVVSTTPQFRLSYNASNFAGMSVSATGELGIVSTSGLVGIGTTDPSYALDVVGTGQFSGDLRLTGALYDSAGSTGLSGDVLTSTGIGTTWSSLGSLLDTSYFKNGGNSFGSVASIGTTDTFALSFITDGTSKLLIDTDGTIGVGGTAPDTAPVLFVSATGEVGIGDTAPGSKLTISGLGSSTGTTMVIDASGNVWRDSSSRRYKTNIEPLSLDFRKILDIQPVSYEFTGTGVHTIGYIAEDVDALGLKDLVVYDQLGQPDAIKYDRLAIYLTEVVKEQQASIDDLQEIALQLDSEGSVEVTLPDTSSLPTSEFEQIDVNQEGNAEFLALQELVNSQIVTDIETIQTKLDTIDEKVTSLDAQLNATDSALMLTDSNVSIASISGRLDDLENQVLGLTTQALTASVSAQLSSNDAIFGDISSTGKANFYDVGITGSLIAGLINIDATTTSINSYGEPLQLQSDKMADVEIMGGLVTISQQGNLDVAGDIQAEKYFVNTSDTVNASAGEGVLKAGESAISIQTESVTNGSLIYVTFTSDYSPASRYWIEGRNNGESFILRTDKPVDSDSSFSWWIVN